MNDRSVDIENPQAVSLTSFVGPFITLMTLTLLMRYPSSFTTYYTLVAIVGVGLSAYLQMNGFFISSLLLIILYGVHIFLGTHLIWYFGVVAAIALCFFVTALSYDEQETEEEEEKEPIQQTTIQQQLQATAERDDFAIINRVLEDNLRKRNDDFEVLLKKYQQIESISEKKIQVEKELLLAKTIECEELKAEIRGLEKRIDPTNETKIIELIQKSQTLEQEVFNLQYRLNSALDDLKNKHLKQKDLEEQISQLNLQNNASQELVSQLQHEQIIQKAFQGELSEQIDALVQEKSLLEKNIHHLETTLKTKDEQEQIWILERKDFYQKITSLEVIVEEKERANQEINVQLNELKVAHEKERKSLEYVINDLNKPKPLPVVRPKLVENRASAMYYQLREQFEEKNRTLEETRRELFYTNEKLAEIFKDSQEKEFETMGCDPSLWQFVEENICLIDLLNEENKTLHHIIDQFSLSFPRS